MGYKTTLVPQYPPGGAATTKVTIATMIGQPGPPGPTGDTGPAGASDLSWSVQSSAYTASAFDRLLADTSGGSFTITLPSDPSAGDAVWFTDAARTWHDNPLTVAGNGNTILGDTELIANLRDESFALVFTGGQWVLGAN